MLRDLYRRARAEGLRAQDAYRQATATPAIELAWQDYDSRATFERDGFTFSITVEPDDDTDLSWLGEWTNTHEPGAVKNPNHSPGQTFEWFVPTYTYAERVCHLREAGRSRGVAAEEARAAVEKDAATAVDYVEYVIGAKCSREGVELGVAYLGGVGLGDDYAANRVYVAEVAAELIDEAADEAAETLARLCDGGQS